MKLLWTSHASDEYLFWQQNDPKTLDRVNELIKECKRTPFQGTGKPEALKGDLKGWWSRRINHEDRLVYRVRGTGDAQQLEIVQCRYHY
ncbi:MAG: Txe/YoeB family addiction module toxin [Hyphomicrobiales bacterium]|jgi:toxin YoeB|nr:Txe/YoeB family addiction module toxin [Hyphomicrobiales bacterium]